MNPKMNEKSNCLYCGDPIKAGRSDKKLCDLECKDKYHHQQRTIEKEEIKKVESVLKSSRKILQKLFEKYEDKPVLLTTLNKAGHNFDYLTHYVTTKAQANRYTFCFNYGYREFDKDRFYVIRGY
jgi:hypothetical protein